MTKADSQQVETAAKAGPEDFRVDGELGVRIHPAHGGFKYSDGSSVERKILGILRDTEDRSLFSLELQRQVDDWPTLYHFSPKRHNLLRHLKLSRQMDVLELGAGCGAITRQLGEAAGEVWAVEGSPVRAACAAARTRELANVRVFCSDFQAFDPGRQFDVVTLIGVLEYAPVFFHEAHPMLACLKLARSLVRPGGTLLLAIENQLGLKYLIGAPEDHTGKAYDGVQDLYRRRGVQTLGKAELGQLLREAGFAAIEFQYPFPDYKMPDWVIAQRGLEQAGFDASAILRLVETTHDGKPAKYAADERLIRPVLARNGILGELANSFLVLASAGEEQSELSDAGLLATGAATNRQPAFVTQSRIVAQGDGTIVVQKRRLIAEAQPPTEAGKLVHQPDVERYQKGMQLERLAVEALTHEGLDAAIAELRRWVDYMIANGVQSAVSGDIFASVVKPQFFDCNPQNLIVDGSELHFIDREWTYLDPIQLRDAVWRYLKPFAKRYPVLLKKHLHGRKPAPMQLAEHLGVRFSRADYNRADEIRQRINRWTRSPVAAASRVGGKRKASIWSRLFQ